MRVTLQNEMSSAMHGYQLKAIAASTPNILDGVSKDFSVLVDPGARHTSVSDAIMRDIIEKVRGSSGKELTAVKTIDVYGVFGSSQTLPIYIIPHLYIGALHFKNISVVSVARANFQCLLGRSVLHQCVLTLDPEANAMTFDFKDSLVSHKELVDGFLPFESVEFYAESGAYDLNAVMNTVPLASD